MSYLQDPQIVAALITVALTAMAAVAGYILREYVATVKPFVVVAAVDGETRRFSTRIDVPSAVLSSLKRACIQSPLTERSTLPDIAAAISMGMDFREKADDFIKLAGEFGKAAKSADVSAAQSVLIELMNDEDFDHWITVLVGERNVPIPSHDAQEPVVVDCTLETGARGGTYSVGFPGHGIRFGSDLNEFGLYRAGLASFLELVKRMELNKLASVFDAAAGKVALELAIAKDILPPLELIADKYSQWSVRIFFANLGKAPFLIQQHAELEIRDQSGAKYTQSCSLIVLREGEDGEVERFEAGAPLVVRSESDMNFEFVTNAIQSEMPAGEAIRVLYKAGSAQCIVRFTVERPGFWRRKTIHTPPVVFKEA